MWRKRMTVVIGLLLVLSFIVTACAKPTPQVVEKKVIQTQIVEKKVVETKVVEKVKEKVVTPTPLPQPPTLDWNLSTEPPTADPALATDTTSVFVDTQLFQGLATFDEKANVVPALATKWEVSDDGLTWTFHMRKDGVWVKYNPAKNQFKELGPVTAFDVEYGVKRTLDPKTASDYAYVLYIIKNAEGFNEGTITDSSKVGVTAVDTYTVQFTLEHPAGYFPAIAGMWVTDPQPKDAIQAHGDRWTEPGFIVSNGPFALKEWVHDDHMVFVRNPKWFGWKNPKAGNIQVINAYMVNEATTAMSMYQNNELDVTSPPLSDMDKVKTDPVLSKQLVIAPVLCTYYYGFVNTKKPFDNPDVRRAFSAAIDRQGLIDNVLKGGQKPAHTFAPPGIFGAPINDKNIAPWALDYTLGKKMAKEWLAKAGYPDGKGFPDVTLMYNTSQGHAKIAQAIQQMWKDVLNVNVTLENQEWKVYLKTMLPSSPDDEKPQIYRLGWCADYPDENNWVNEVFNSKSDNNWAKYNNPEFDKIVKEAEKSSDPETRKQLYDKAEKLLVDTDAAIAPIYYYTRVTLTKPWLKRTFGSQPGLEHVWKWSVDMSAKLAAKK